MTTWIDVATTAIPRLLTDRCIRSFLDRWTDRCDYRVRWLFHLDGYPYPGLEQNWDENMRQAEGLSSLFDDVLLSGSRPSAGYGESVCGLMAKVRQTCPTFWIEDDKFWLKDFSLAEILRWMERDGANSFGFRPLMNPGSTYPSFYAAGVLGGLLERIPRPHWKVTEQVICSVAVGMIRVSSPSLESFGKYICRGQYEGSWCRDIGWGPIKRNRAKPIHPSKHYVDRETGELVMRKTV